MSYTVVSGVTAVSVLKSDLSALPAGASVTTNTVSGTTASLVIAFTDAVAPLEIVVVAQGNSSIRQSAASASQNLLGIYAAPTISGSPSYTNVSAGSYTVSMSYTVDSRVTAVSVLKSDLSALPAGASVTTNTVSGTTASLVIAFTDAVAPLGIVVIAQGNTNGRQSASSATQTLIKRYAAPTISGSIIYSGSGPYTASMTYTVETGVTAVSVLKSDLSALPAGASVTTNTVSGTTASLVISFTDAGLSLNIVVIAQGNASGRESAASATQTLQLSAAEIVYSGTVPSTPSFNSQFTLSSPSGVAVDASGNIFIALRNSHTIFVYDNMGVYVRSFGSLGTGNGQLSTPHSVTIDLTGNIIVSNWSSNNIQVFSNSGTFIRSIGSYGTGDGQLNTPTGVVVDGTGNIIVAEYSNNRVQVFSSTGTFIRKFGSSGTGDGQFSFPYGIAVRQNGNILVVDRGNSRVQEFSSTGTYISKKIFSGQNPSDVAVDKNDNIVVSTAEGIIYIYDSSWNLITTFGSNGSGKMQFNTIMGVAIDQTGRIIVSDISFE
jgi:DNA-binding beta-propeller fold protein YncE